MSSPVSSRRRSTSPLAEKAVQNPTADSTSDCGSSEIQPGDGLARGGAAVSDQHETKSADSPPTKLPPIRNPGQPASKTSRAGTPRRPQGAKVRAALILERLIARYPEARCALTHQNPFQLLAATILSAQCTDVRVNLTTPALFARFPDPASLARADLAEVETLIRSTGFYHNKALNLIGMARAIVEHHGGVVPDDYDALTALPGVGRKTANVVMGDAFGRAEGVVVDTHVKRLAFRMGLTRHHDPIKIERDLMAILPRDQWVGFSHRMIFHGRDTCDARKPRCESCILADLCPKVGVESATSKPRRARFSSADE